MKKLLAAVLLFAVVAGPVFAKKPKQHHQKIDYRYHAPKYKYKAPKSHNHHSHNPAKNQPK